MDNLHHKIKEDMKDAMRSKQTLRLGTIRMLLAAIKQIEIDSRITLDDPGISSIIQKMIKQRNDAAQQYQDAARQELADKELAEAEILFAYLPQQLNDEEITAAVSQVIAEIEASSIKDMGKVMAKLSSQLQGKADMSVVGVKVKQLLNA